MADPAVCGFVTKVLCSRGGGADLAELLQHVALPEQQLRLLLQDAGPQRFLLLGQGDPAAAAPRVLAVSPVRVCVRRQCAGCSQLHLCKSHLRGRCRVRACKYNHDIFSEENRKVLKIHELSGLNEDELHVLLLQNDPFLLPDVCRAYNKGDGNCSLQENCPKLHICHYFLRGECRFPLCKRSHSLVNPTALKLLLAEGVDDKVAWNIQRICEHKTLALFKEIRLQKGPRPAVHVQRVKPRAGYRKEHTHEQTSGDATLVDSKLRTKTLVIENSGYLSTPRPATSGGSDKPDTGDQEEYNLLNAACAGMQNPEQVPVKTPLQNLNPEQTSVKTSLLLNLNPEQAPVKTPLQNLNPEQTSVNTSLLLNRSPEQTYVKTHPLNPNPDLAPVKTPLQNLNPEQTSVNTSLLLNRSPEQTYVKTHPLNRSPEQTYVKTHPLNQSPEQAPVKTPLQNLNPEQAPVKTPLQNLNPEQTSVKTSLLLNRSPEQTYVKIYPEELHLSLGAKVPDLFKPSQKVEKTKSDEICLHYLWRFCKNKNDCSMVHYHLPYRWQIQSGVEWKDCANMEEIEKAYCDPSTTSFPTLNINFKTMLSYINPVRRLSTPSSVTQPATFVMTTKWLWYWKNDRGQWIEYGKPDGQRPGSNLSSDDLENVFLADPDGCVQFHAGSQHYEINFKDMVQRNVYYLTQRELRRRPKFVSAEDEKNKKGHADHATSSALTSERNYPKEWDKSALPEIGYKAIEVSKMSPEFVKIEKLFQKTMNTYVIQKIRRIQNPSLWQVFQWQKDQMKKKRRGRDVDERLLFHGTSSSSVEAICTENFDWRICGTNGTVYGKGSYFARDAQYSHNYCQREAKVKTMFVAQVLVGDFITGHANYTRPPVKSTGTLNSYDSCVDRLVDPSIFIIFEKHQIYPAYIIDYTEEEKKCVIA
ncbi:protein mono-ADP-ribosyltransferase PARP12-like isoform X2 [Tiliqua scincoides]|uniref:protein mono-ADP-ribosyltransferase PARP12-like isoform X2 n=1 Tax=Tiliqua scincoides TaxID=71010 RepID=UPI0034624BAE